MGKKIKLAFIGFISVVIVLGAVVIAIPYFIDAHVLRTQITRAVQDATGRELTISGDIKWAYYPSFSLEIDKAALANPANFPEKTPFASIEKLELAVEILPLIFSRHIVMSELTLDGANINFVTLASGQSNWEDLLTRAPTNETASESAHEADQESGSKAPEIKFNIAEFSITNSDLIYDNQERKEHWELSELSVEAESLTTDHIFPISLKGKLHNPENDQIFDLSFNSDVNANPAEHSYLLKSPSLSGTIISTDNTEEDNSEGNEFTVKLEEVAINTATETYDLKKLVFDGFGSHATGDFQVKNAGAYPQVVGELKLDKLKLGHLIVTDVTLPVNGQNGIYSLQPINSKFYEGTLKGNVTARVTSSLPSWQLSYQLADVQMKPLLTDWKGYDHITGTLTSSGQFVSSGVVEHNLMGALTGATQVNLVDGSFEGIDIAYWWEVGDRLLHGNPDLSGLTDTKTTKVTNLSGNFTFREGFGTTNNLQLYNDVIFVRAQGNIDLLQEYVNLNLFVSKSNNGKAGNTEIPLILSGSFSGGLHLQPDEKAIAVMAGKALTTKAGKAAVNAIKEKVPALKQPLTNAINKLTGKSNTTATQ